MKEEGRGEEGAERRVCGSHGIEVVIYWVGARERWGVCIWIRPLQVLERSFGVSGWCDMSD